MKTPKLFAFLAGLLIPLIATAQNSAPANPPTPGANGVPDVGSSAVNQAQAAGAAMPVDPALTAAPAQPVTAPQTSEARPAPMPAQPSSGKDAIRLNFQGAQLSDVLNYLSEAAGFVIVQESPVSGTVNIVSKQTITADEAVDLLNTVLLEKGFTAMRNGRILKIVNRSKVQTRSDLPVVQGSAPQLIPRNDNIVTQIMPVRYVDAGKLVENLRPLLSDNATITANDSSNAIIFTDTQANIHRIAEIIRALDTSISGISTIHVFGLRYADAKELAAVITQLFTTDTSARGGQNNNGGGGGGFPGFPGFGGGGGGRGGGGGGRSNTPQSEARQAASRVIAVADTQSNSVIVSAPDEFMATITEVVSRLDTSITDVSETRIFRLQHADASELAGIVNTLYADNGTSNASNQGRGGNQGQPGQFGQRGGGGGGGGGRNQNQNAPSERALLEAHVVAVPDPRTNSVIVSASRDTMENVALTIGRLDSSDSKKQHTYVIRLENADPQNVAEILRGMYTDQSATNSNQNATSVLTQRQNTGASLDPSSVMSGGSGSSGARGGGARSSGGF